MVSRDISLVSQGKADTYSVEAHNAESHHYLAHLARHSRCREALKAVLECFMYAFNRCPLYKQCFPNYPIIRHMFTNSSKPMVYPLPHTCACNAGQFMLKSKHGDGNPPDVIAFPERRIFVLLRDKIAHLEWFYLSMRGGLCLRPS